MIQIASYQARNLRFKRWSRKSYAVFCSLGVSVSIGQLAVNVQEKSLMKTEISRQSVLTESSFNEKEESDESQELLTMECQVLNQVIVNQQDAAAAGFPVCLYDILIFS